MRIYLAGPLFSAAERDWNATLAAALRGAREMLDALARLEAPAGRLKPGKFR